MDTVIEVRGLTKSFGRSRALDGLDLVVGRAEVHGFLGPNGSGKTTTLRCLLGLLRADGGTAHVLGLDPWTDRVELHRRLAYVPGDVALWPSMTGGEVIDLLGRLRGGLDDRRRADLISRFDLDPTKRTRAYSKGNRQKVALIAALASDVDVLLLDEPTSGLDPLMEAEFRKVIREWRADGGSVLLSSHILSEAEALADRISIIRDGRTVESGSLDELRHLTRTTVDAQLRTMPADVAAIAGVHDTVLDTDLEGTHLHCRVDTAALDPLLASLAGAGLASLTVQPPTLEELFLQHYPQQVSVPGG